MEEDKILDFESVAPAVLLTQIDLIAGAVGVARKIAGPWKPIRMKATRQSEPPRNPFNIPQGSAAAPSNPLAALAGANAFGLAASNPVMFGHNTRQHAMDMAGGNPPTWRSPYNNPDLEYVYLGSPQTSQGSPQTHLPDPVTSFVSNNPHNLQPAPGNVYPQQQGFATAVMAGAQPGYIPVGDTSYQYLQLNHRAATQPQAFYGEAETQQFEDIWSALESVEYTVTAEDISMVEAYAPPGVAPDYGALSMLSCEEAEGSTRVALANADYGNVVGDPRLEFMDMAMDDQISDAFSSTSPSSQQMPHGYGANHHVAAERSSRPESDFRESGFPNLLAPGQSGIRHLGETRWAEQLLNLCAGAIASKNISRTRHLMWVLNDLASVVGDANQRVAAYGLRALFCRITGRMEAAATFLRPRHKEQEVSFGPKTVHRALVKFHEYVPWHQNCYSVTSQTLLEVCAGKSRVHLIDIGAGKGIEWPIFIDALVSRSGGPPSLLRMTMIRDLRREELNMHTAKSANSEAADFMTRLVNFASVLGLHVEVNMVQKPLECVTRDDLRLRDGEILAVVCQFRLHRLSEEAPASRLSPRDEFFDFLYKLEPDVFIFSDNDCDHCSQDFLTRFQSAIGFWWGCFEAIEIGYNGRDPEERQILEYEGAMMLLNMVACEGIARIERNEAYSQWERRVRRAGFAPRDLSEEARKVSQNLVQNHSEFWDVAFPEPNMVSLQWRKQPTTFTSVWKVPSCSKSACKCNMLHS